MDQNRPKMVQNINYEWKIQLLLCALNSLAYEKSYAEFKVFWDILFFSGKYGVSHSVKKSVFWACATGSQNRFPNI